VPTRPALYFALAVAAVPGMAAELPAGTVTCAAPFQLDGVSVANTATLFAWNRIGDSAGSCTIRRTAGGTVWLQPQTEVVITPLGVELAHGTLRMAGKSQLSIPSVPAVIEPESPQTLVNARFFGSQWIVNPVAGPAQLTGKNAEIYMRLGAGSMATLLPSSDQPSGLDVQVLGCLHWETNNWFIDGEHLAREVELDAETVRKEHQEVWIWGALEPMTPDSPNITARLRVQSEKPAEGVCRAFKPVTELDNTITSKESTATIALAIAAAVGSLTPGIISATSSSLVPGTATATPSLP